MITLVTQNNPTPANRVRSNLATLVAVSTTQSSNINPTQFTDVMNLSNTSPRSE